MYKKHLEGKKHSANQVSKSKQITNTIHILPIHLMIGPSVVCTGERATKKERERELSSVPTTDYTIFGTSSAHQSAAVLLSDDQLAGS